MIVLAASSCQVPVAWLLSYTYINPLDYEIFSLQITNVCLFLFTGASLTHSSPNFRHLEHRWSWSYCTSHRVCWREDSR